MIYFIPVEHFLKSISKTKILFIFSLFLTLNLYGQNATNGGSIGNNSNICPGETPPIIQNLTPASGGGTTAIEYLWMTTNNPGQAITNWNIASGTNNQASYSPPIIGTTTYFIRCARRQGFTEYIAESNIVAVTVLPYPTAQINGNPGSVSVGATVNFSASNSSNSTYSWDFDNDGNIDCTGQNCSNTFSTEGTFTISMTVNNGLCSWTDTEEITIVNPSAVSIVDPCDCNNNQNFANSDGFFVHDYIFITAATGENWQITDIPSGMIYTSSATPISLGTQIAEVTNSPGSYYLSFWFKSGDGYQLNVSNSNATLTTGTTDPCSCINPLPVELVSFDAFLDERKNEITLKWATASELNNSHFEVQRSLDGNRFDFLDVVQGNGNTSLLQSYTSIDKYPVPGENYYRLKQVDFDGSQTYSDIVSVKISTESIISSVIPNPIQDVAIVRFGEKMPRHAKLQVLSATGQVMATYLVEDKISQEIILERFEKGIYFLRIKNAERKERAFFKVVKF